MERGSEFKISSSSGFQKKIGLISSRVWCIGGLTPCGIAARIIDKLIETCPLLQILQEFAQDMAKKQRRVCLSSEQSPDLSSAP